MIRQLLFSFAFIFLIHNVYAQKFGIDHYEIDVTATDSMRALNVCVMLDLINLDLLSGDTLKLDLGKGFKGVNCDYINVNIDKKPLVFHFNKEKEIHISLPDSVRKNNQLRLNISYVMLKAADYNNIPYSDFAFQVNKDQIHINSAITRTDNWFPKLVDTQSYRLPPFNLNITIPDDYEVMASGKLVKVIEMNEGRKHCYTNYEEITDRGLYFFVSRKQKMQKIYPDGFKMYLYIPADTLPGNVAYLSDMVYQSYKFYESVFGPTGLNEYKLSAFVNNSMGYSGLFNSCNIPESLFTDSIKNNELLHPVRNVIHEVSHTWWGNIISADAGENYWLFEGFAKFSEPVFLKTIAGEEMELLYQKRLKLVLNPVIDFIPSLRFNSFEVTGSERNSGAYYQGALFLLSLKRLMGEENFWKGMKQYVSDNRGRLVDSDDFFEAMQSSTEKDLSAYYYDYLNKPGFAEYTLRFLSCTKMESGFLHEFELRNTGNKELFTNVAVQSGHQWDTTDVYIPKGESLIIEVKSDGKDTVGLVHVDPEDIFLVREQGMYSSGAKLYTDSYGRVRLSGVVEGSPFANAGLKSRMILVSLEGENMENLDIYEKHAFIQRKKGSILNGTFIDLDGVKKEYEILYQ